MKCNWPRLAPIFYQFSGTKCFIQPHYTHANVKNNKLWFLFLFVSRISRNSISISVNGIHVSFIFWGCWLHGSIVLFVTYIWLTVSIKLYFWYLIIFFSRYFCLSYPIEGRPIYKTHISSREVTNVFVRWPYRSVIWHFSWLYNWEIPKFDYLPKNLFDRKEDKINRITSCKRLAILRRIFILCKKLTGW